jgi:hypothetical protein
MIEVVGDAMAPTLRPGTQMIVDRLDTVPSPPGLFLVANAVGEQPQRREIVPNSKPLRIREFFSVSSFGSWPRAKERSPARPTA